MKLATSLYLLSASNKHGAMQSVPHTSLSRVAYFRTETALRFTHLLGNVLCDHIAGRIKAAGA
jgi:hypothetical protein